MKEVAFIFFHPHLMQSVPMPRSALAPLTPRMRRRRSDAVGELEEIDLDEMMELVFGDSPSPTTRPMRSPGTRKRKKRSSEKKKKKKKATSPGKHASLHVRNMR